MRLITGLSLIYTVGLCGCATTAQAPVVEGLPGITAYYEQATGSHRRAVRKPIRDERTHALRMLAQKSDELLKKSAAWDSEVRLVSIAEGERAALRSDVADFRSSLESLRDAASRAKLESVRTEYAHALSSYRQLAATLEIGP